jgi:hypothetical protein
MKTYMNPAIPRGAFSRRPAAAPNGPARGPEAFTEVFPQKQERHMTHRIGIRGIVAVAALWPAAAWGQLEQRGSYSQKGDLFVWPYVVVRWEDKPNGGGATGTFGPEDVAQQDVFIAVSQDAGSPGRLLRLVFGAHLPPPATPDPNCPTGTWERSKRTLVPPSTMGEHPWYFSAFTGSGALMNNVGGSFQQLVVDGTNLGEPDNGPFGGANIRKAEGFIVGWTVASTDTTCPVGGNSMAGSALVIDYKNESAWEYKPWVFRSNFTGNKADKVKLKLNGDPAEYQKVPSHLLVDFWSSGNLFPPPGGTPNPAFGPNPSGTTSDTDFELTLVNMAMDFRGKPDFDMDGITGESPDDGPCQGPPVTSVEVLTWNEFESQVSGTRKCLTCWDSTLASRFRFANMNSPFSFSALQTKKGKGRLWGAKSISCDRAAVPATGVRAKPSFNLPILGVAHTIVKWGATGRCARGGSALIGMGERTDGFVFCD